MHATEIVVREVQSDSGFWDAAIRKAKQKIARLREDIVMFEEMRDSGESWPGTTEVGCYPVTPSENANELPRG